MNEGKGSAIKTGFKYSHGNIVAFIDADVSNFTSEKIDKIIKPILEDRTDITKTKFARESGRVTELTAKPLLGFFFPELDYEQPLSGQFAGKRSALSKIRFEKDYGVDVGIVLDADVHGIKILEVDIGDICHDMSPLADLNKMANEVVRTIIDRAVEYGRVTMMDKLGNYIRMAIMGLSLIILGLFMIFFVPFIPVLISVFVAFIGVVLTIFYFLRIIRRSIPILKKSNTRASLQSFVRMHFPLIVAGLILILMLSTFLSAASFDDGKISVELTSRNFVYAPSDHNQQTISVRGPYTIDSALENETDILRVPHDALSTLEMTENDTMIIDGKSYNVNGTKEGDNGDRFRLPSKVKRELDLSDGEVIPNSHLTEIFQNVTVKHNIQFNNLSDVLEGFVEFDINPKSTNATFFNLTLDNESILSSVGNFEKNTSYSISYDGNIMCTFDYDDVKNGNLTFSFDGKDGMIEFANRNSTSIRNYVSSDRDSFVQLRSLE
jgi:glycosyltransferase involved in cell wall biosynthesis